MSSVSRMTFLLQFDWGLMPGDRAQPDQRITFAFTLASGTLSATINELIEYLSSKLATTNIRVFRVPSPRRLAAVCD